MTHEDAVSSRLREETMALMAYSPTVSLLDRIPFDKGVVGDCHEAARAAIRLGDEPVVDLAMFAQRTEERPGEANTRTVLGTLDYLLKRRGGPVVLGSGRPIPGDWPSRRNGVDPSCRSPIRVAVQSIPLDEISGLIAWTSSTSRSQSGSRRMGPPTHFSSLPKPRGFSRLSAGCPSRAEPPWRPSDVASTMKEERRAAGYRPSTTLSRRMPLDV